MNSISCTRDRCYQSTVGHQVCNLSATYRLVRAADTEEHCSDCEREQSTAAELSNPDIGICMMQASAHTRRPNANMLVMSGMTSKWTRLCHKRPHQNLSTAKLYARFRQRVTLANVFLSHFPCSSGEASTNSLACLRILSNIPLSCACALAF